VGRGVPGVVVPSRCLLAVADPSQGQAPSVISSTWHRPTARRPGRTLCAHPPVDPARRAPGAPCGRAQREVEEMTRPARPPPTDVLHYASGHLRDLPGPARAKQFA